MAPLLYSTNPFLKLLVQERFRGNVHYVWCSESFDSRVQAPYTAASLVPRSSNPAEILEELQRAVASGDTHASKIIEARATFTNLANIWFGNGEVTADERDEIIYMANNSGLEPFRPLLYVIPRPATARLMVVPPSQRAGIGIEYIITDLQRSEFDVLEVACSRR